MPKEIEEHEQKEEKKKNAKKATQKGKGNKEKREAKKLGDKALLAIADQLPAGGAKALLQITMTCDKLKEQRKAINLAIRGERAKLKEMKIELRVYDHCIKLRDMAPEDARAFRATEALYTEQLGMEMSPAQQEQVAEINRKRDEARTLMSGIAGDSTGEEVGSSTDAGLIGHNSEKGAGDAQEAGEGEENAPRPGVPARNTVLSHG